MEMSWRRRRAAMLAPLARADGGTVRDDARLNTTAFHPPQYLQSLLPLPAALARADGRTVRDDIRLKANALHLLQQVPCVLPLVTCADNTVSNE